MSLPPPIPEDGLWHQRLMQTLADCERPQRPRRTVLRYFLAFFVGVAFALLSSFVNYAIRNSRGQPDVQIVASIAWILFAIFVLSRVRNRFFRRFAQARARTAEEELTRSSTRRPVLYLRSFALDERIGRPSFLERFLGTVPLATAEQEMTRTLRKVGPVIAIGRPGEVWPSLGAAKFYVAHDKWQQKVAEVVRDSKYVVWASGITEGLRWELAHLIEALPPEKLILWAHPHLLRVDAEEREAEWQRFRQSLGNILPKPLPERLGDARFFYFNSRWEPRGVAPSGIFSRFLGAQRSALRALLKIKSGERAEEEVVYHPPSAQSLRYASLRGLLGVTAWPVRWQLLVCFAGARLAILLPTILVWQMAPLYARHNQADFGIAFGNVLLGTLIQTVAAAIAYYWVRKRFAAAMLTAALVTLTQVVQGPPPAHFGFGFFLMHFCVAPFLTCLPFYAVLGWAVAKFRPLWLALGIGAIVHYLLLWAIMAGLPDFFGRLDARTFSGGLIGSIIFPAVYLLLLNWLHRPKEADGAAKT